MPGGPSVSGVTLFALRLAGALARAGGQVTLILHAPPPGHTRLDLAGFPGLDAPGLRIVDLTDRPRLEDLAGDIAPIMPAYRAAVHERDGAGPAALILGQHETAFAAAAALSQVMPESIRCIGVAHSDNGYDTSVLRTYEPMLHGLVGVSDELAEQLRRSLPERSAEVRMIPYGVEVPTEPVARDPLADRPLRLLYTGRLEHRQKRVLALGHLSTELERRGIPHELTVHGDGPAADALRDACAGSASVRIGPAVSPAEVSGLLDAHDVFVLPSRYEGLSVAMLEALAHGCVPVVAPSRSGTLQALRAGVTGEIAGVDPDADEEATALALADAIEALRRRDLPEMSRRCHAGALARFSIDVHAAAWCSVISDAGRAHPRPWPATRPCSPSPGTSGTDQHAASTLRSLLDEIGDVPICVHGSGRFAASMAPELVGARVVAVTDDDRQRHGDRFLGCEIVPPQRAGASGAKHLIILSAMHEDAIWQRRAVYESQGLTVHRLHAADG